MGREAVTLQEAVANTTDTAIAACNDSILDLAFFMVSWGFTMKLSLW